MCILRIIQLGWTAISNNNSDEDEDEDKDASRQFMSLGQTLAYNSAALAVANNKH